MGNPLSIEIYVLADDKTGLNNPFIAQHGASYWIRTRYSEKTVNILFDTGTYSAPILENMKRLGLNPGSLDYIVISHNHYDHTGGLLGILDEIGHTIPLIGPSSISKVSIHIGDAMRIIGPPIHPYRFMEELIAKGAYPVLVDEPIKIVDGIWTTGVFSHCVENRHTYYVIDGRLVPDKLCDEISLVVDLGNKGLVIAGCAHPGIDKIVEKASGIIGKRIEYVMGGFHLIGREESEIERIIIRLRELGVKKLFPGHCSGLEAEYLMKKIYGGNCEPLYVGLKIIVK